MDVGSYPPLSYAISRVIHQNELSSFPVLKTVHNKISLEDNMMIEQLISVLEGEAKRSVESIGCNGIYATALKSLKRDFGNPILVSHLKIKALLD